MGCDVFSVKVAESLLGISIHASAWDATRPIDWAPGLPLFQSTHPHGMRLSAASPCPTSESISIHASAWDATVTIFYLYGSRGCKRFSSNHANTTIISREIDPILLKNPYFMRSVNLPGGSCELGIRTRRNKSR